MCPQSRPYYHSFIVMERSGQAHLGSENFRLTDRRIISLRIFKFMISTCSLEIFVQIEMSGVCSLSLSSSILLPSLTRYVNWWYRFSLRHWCREPMTAPSDYYRTFTAQPVEDKWWMINFLIILHGKNILTMQFWTRMP